MRFVSRNYMLLMLMLLLGSSVAMAQSTSNMYVITLNGEAVTVDGDLTDWADAQFFYMSQDMPHGLYIDTDANNEESISGPDDFSGYVAMKMDMDNIYFAAKVRDDFPLIYSRTDTSAANLFNTEHLGVYIGLYDIGDAGFSPHTNVVNVISPTTGDTLAGGRTYRVAPGWDDDSTNATLGADYQIGVHFQTYETVLDNGAFYAADSAAVTQAYAYLGVPINNTEIAVLLADDGVTYTAEWKVPFASLAGQLQADTSNAMSQAEFPLYTPADGDVIPFDIDLTDDDRVGKDLGTGGNDFLRYGTEGALWLNSFGMSGRGVVRDAADIGKANYFYGLYSPAGADVTVDGDISDWSGAHFIGISQDTPTGLYIDTDTNNEENLSGPDDFSGYVAVQLDDDNIYFAAKIRDDVPLIYTRTDTSAANLFNTEHLGVYTGLYNIGPWTESPHVDVVNIISPTTGDTLAGGRTYRVAPGWDDDPFGATQGADYQMGVHMQVYGTELDNGGFYASGTDAVTQNYGYLGVPINDTEVAVLLDSTGTFYTAEWKVPFSSLAGQLQSDTSNAMSQAEYPLYTPADGHIIPIDFDLTDDDRIGKDLGTGGNDFLRYGQEPALWLNSYRVGLRLAVSTGADVRAVNVEELDGFDGPNDVPQEFALKQNYPNPFNPVTTIEFDLAQAGEVSLKVYNLLGQEVATLVNDNLQANRYQVRWDATGFASGMYVYRLEVGDQVEVRKMILLK